MTTSGAAIEAVDLVKTFGDFTAVDGVSFSVPEGTVFSMLGPNGAGKTTTVRMMTTLSRPTSGTARVAGLDVVRDADAVRRRMGLTAQSATVDELLTGRENLRLVGDLYGLDRRTVRRVADELLERFSLTDAATKVVKEYSGGMRRRLDLAASLVATPPVLFLDEPTTGLDPRSRVELWGVLRDLVREGTTLFLTTQYLDEADQLADRIVVVDHGRVIADGTPLELKDRSGAASLVIAVSRPAEVERAAEIVRGEVGEIHLDRDARRITAPAEGVGALTRIAPGSTRPASTSTTSGCSGRASTTSSSPSPGTGPSPRPPVPRPTPAPRRPCDDRPDPHDRRRSAVPRRAPERRRHEPGPPDLGAGAPQPDPHQAPARDAHRRHHPAGDVRAALRLRLRRLDRRARRRLQGVAAAGIMAQTMTFSAFIVAIGLNTDLGKGIVDRFRSLPIGRSSVVVARSVSSLIHSMIGIVVMSVTGLFVGWGIHHGVLRGLAGYGLLLLFGFAMIWVGILFGSALRSVEAVQGVMFTTVFPITFLSNAFARTDVMPDWLRFLAEWNPISSSSRRCASSGATTASRCRPTRRCPCSTRC